MTDFEVPQAVRDRAAELLAGSLQVVPLRDAATVVLLRDCPGGLEVYMQRRTSTLTFAAGMYVFPGGRVEEQDADPLIAFAGEPPQPPPFAIGGDIVLRQPGPDDPGAVYRSLLAAAVRETLEEAGVLLGTVDGRPADDLAAHRVREALLSGEPLSQALAAASVRLDFDRLIGFAHWMTPAVEVRRFDTRFFLAALPPSQRAGSVSGESDAHGWVRPDAMLARLSAGEVVMLPPTVAALTALRRVPDAATAIAAGHRRGLRPVLPHPFAEDGGIRWRLIDGYTGQPLAAP